MKTPLVGPGGPRLRASRGISLLEVMASTAVLLIVFMSITLLLGSSRDLQETVDDDEAALFHAEGMKEAIAGTGFNNIPLRFPADGTDLTTTQWGDGVTKSLAAETVTLTYASGPDLWGTGQNSWDDWMAGGQNPADIPDPLEFTIVTAWTSFHGQQTRSLTVARASSVP